MTIFEKGHGTYFPGDLVLYPGDLMKNLETPGKTGRVGRSGVCHGTSHVPLIENAKIFEVFCQMSVKANSTCKLSTNLDPKQS